MDNTQDVTADSSAANQEAAVAAGTAPAPVTAAQVDDRPVQNVIAEFNRKYTKLQDQLNQVMQVVSQQHQAQQAPTKGPASDDELWQLAQQGDRTAFELYQERIADRRARAVMAEQNQANIVDQQLTSLAQRYPVFNDTGHPL